MAASCLAAEAIAYLVLVSAGAILGSNLISDSHSPVSSILSIAIFFLLVEPQSLFIATSRGLGFGLGTGLVSGCWVPEALRSLGSTSLQSFLGLSIAVAWSALPSVLALSLAVSWLDTRLGTRSSIARLLPVGAIVFVVDYVLMRVPGAVPWTLWGYASIDDPGLSQLASIGSVPLVSSVVAMGGWVIAECLRSARNQPEYRLTASVLAALLATSCGGLAVARFLGPAARDGAQAARFVAIQPNVSRAERLRPSLQSLNMERMIRVSRGAIAPDGNANTIVLWPENSVVIRGERSQVSAIAAKLAREVGATMIAGVMRIENHAIDAVARNSIVAIGRDGEIVDLVDKHMAVPVIESDDRSILSDLAARTIGAAGRWTKVEESQHLAPLNDTSGAAVALCYEILFPWIVDARRPISATAILNLADDSWVESEIATRQLTAIARFRAIEQRLPLIRVAHGGLTAIFDPFGQPVEALPLDRHGSLVWEGHPSTRPGFAQRSLLLLLPVGSGLGAWLVYPYFLRAGNALRRGRLD